MHFDGADFEDLTYRVSFGEPDAAGRQPLRLHALTGDQAREDAAAGDLVLESPTPTSCWTRQPPARSSRTPSFWT